MFNKMSTVLLLLHFNSWINILALEHVIGSISVVVANSNYANYIHYYNNPKKRKK